MSDTILTGSHVTTAGDPFVALSWGSESGQLPPATARALGLRIVMAADAAEHDAALVRSLRHHDVPEAMLGHLLVSMREERAQMEEWSLDLPDAPEATT